MTGWGAPPTEDTPVRGTVEEEKCGLPVLQGVEQGTHCLEGVPISSTLPACSGRIVNFARPVPPKDGKG